MRPGKRNYPTSCRDERRNLITAADKKTKKENQACNVSSESRRVRATNIASEKSRPPLFPARYLDDFVAAMATITLLESTREEMKKQEWKEERTIVEQFCEKDICDLDTGKLKHDSEFHNGGRRMNRYVVTSRTASRTFDRGSQLQK